MSASLATLIVSGSAIAAGFVDVTGRNSHATTLAIIINRIVIVDDLMRSG